MTAGTYDFEVRRGNNAEILFRCLDGVAPFDLTGSEMIFRATYRGAELLRKTTANAGMAMATPSNGEVTLPISVAESRTLPLGKITAYELERRVIGGQQTLAVGKITALEGVNDDA